MDIILIGAGNVGFHLGQALYAKGFKIKQVFSRSLQKAKALGVLINAVPIDNLQETQQADWYILAVPDKVIAEVAKQLAGQIPTTSLVVHCSGATPSTVLIPASNRIGVFYPLQTFSVSQKPDFSVIPFCIDANTDADIRQLKAIASKLSKKVYAINDEQRAVLHVAAVFVNNFSNYLFQIGEEILQKEQVPFDLIRPLIEATAQKVQHDSPKNVQTGPAIRGDQNTINRHLNYLEKYPEYQEIYALFSEKIKNNTHYS